MIVSTIRVPLLATSKIVLSSSAFPLDSNFKSLSNASAYNLTESYKYAAEIDTNYKI